MKNELMTGGIGTALSVVGTSLQTNELLQTISLIITIIGGLISFIIVPSVNWHKNAKKDGKIDKNELKGFSKIVDEGSNKIKEEIDKTKEGK